MDRDSRADLDSARAGDRDALERLLVAQLPALRGYLRLRIGEKIRAKESCSDLAQSVCREALADLGEFEYRGEAAFRKWLFERAHNKVLVRARYYDAGKRAASLEVAPPDASDSAAGDADLAEAYASLHTPSQAAMGREGVERIEAAVDALSEAQKEAVLLHRIVGMSYAEIAAATGKSEGAVRTNVYRGLADLGVRLAQEPGASESPGDG